MLFGIARRRTGNPREQASWLNAGREFVAVYQPTTVRSVHFFSGKHAFFDYQRGCFSGGWSVIGCMPKTTICQKKNVVLWHF